MNNFPSRAEYVEAMQFPHVSFQAKEIKNSTPIYNGDRLIQYSGGYSTVFPIVQTSTGKKHALRLWNADIGEAKIRTSAISKFIQSKQSKYFVDFRYIDRAVLVNGSSQPAILMDWVDGMNLKDYVHLHIKDTVKIKSLASDLRSIFRDFGEIGIAHGDLQHGNILVKKNGKPVLVDYDSMYIDDLNGMRDIIKGLSGYQHPTRVENKFVNPRLDYFSQLIIYLSLLVFADNPELWNKYYPTEDLLFSSNDFKNPLTSSLIIELKKSSNKEIKFLVNELRKELRKKNFDKLKSLEDLLFKFQPDKRDYQVKKILTKSSKDSIISNNWHHKVKAIIDKF